MNRNLRKSEHENAQDLEWVAFCYIADELSESEAVAFETRLENDELAQQALVAAMQQSQTIYAALNETALNETAETANPIMVTTVASEPSGAGRRIPGFLFAAAAALMLMVAGWGWYVNQNTNENVAETIVIESNSHSNGDSEQLAEAWLQTLAAFEDQDWDEVEEDEPEYAYLDEEPSDDWMFIALTDMESSSEGAE